MALERISRDWRWAKLALALCAFALTAACTLLVGPYPTVRDWPFGKDVTEVTLELQPLESLFPPPQTIRLSRTMDGIQFLASSPGEGDLNGRVSIKYLGSNALGRVYGYAIPKSDLPEDTEGHKTKSDLRISQDRAASAYYGMVLIKATRSEAPDQELALRVPVCDGASAEECTYETSAAVWALLAAKVPEMTFKDMPIYVIRH
ncbi:hypothetical protein PbB2_02126 [Candidatus Phycosocius bacilliformis]|uniref:Lipoprotein n=2 Tax=Candidatus Phycosocius bacilliformis TaxID=1445552 RepID=A0A2P2EBK7_9PROT|nr:hypothetical protein PbB2_02126 [Candidatus Phycosocius bacilliformis]